MSKVSLSLSLVASTLLLSCGGGGSSGTIPLDTNITQTPQQQAIERIARYAREGGTLPTLQDYNDAGVVGVNAQNIDAINAKIVELSYEDVDTLEELNTLLQSYNLSLDTNQTNGSGTLVPPSNETKPTENNQTTPPVETPTFTPLKASFDTNTTALTYQEAQNYTLTQEPTITSADGTPEVSYWLNNARVEIKDVLALQVGDNNLTVIVEEQDGDREKQTFTQNITVQNPECPSATISYAPLPTDPQAGDTFTPQDPTIEGRDGNTTHDINGKIVPAGVPYKVIADVNYTVRTVIAPYIEGCPVQTETNETKITVSTPLALEATFFQPNVSVNLATDTYTLSADQIFSATNITTEGDGNITTNISLVDENGTIIIPQNGVYTFNAGEIYTVQATATEKGDTPKTRETATVTAGEIFEALPEIATPSIANSSSSSTTSSRTVDVPEGLSLVVDGVNKGEGRVTFTIGTGSHTAQFINGVGRVGEKDTFSHTYVKPNEAPTTAPDTATTEYNTPVTINVLANDTDPDGNNLSVSSITQSTNGTATKNSDGTITYTPKAGFSGPDTFQYTTADGKGGYTVGTVTVTVNAEVIPAPTDTDGDGLTDNEEATIGTNPNNADTDQDLLKDGEEVKTYGTDPLKMDTDNDGVDDRSELQNGTDPLVSDQGGI